MEHVNTIVYMPHNDTAHKFMLFDKVPSKEFMKKQIDKLYDGEYCALAEYVDVGQCGCMHDCCGHWNVSGVRIIAYDDIYHTAIIRVDSNRNV